MIVAHSFRLREPWQCEVLQDRVRWSRGFHKPSGLESGHQLWIVVSGAPPDLAASVNETKLELADPQQCGQYEVTSLVAEANHIVLECPNDGATNEATENGFPFDVRLAIVEP